MPLARRTGMTQPATGNTANLKPQRPAAPDETEGAGNVGTRNPKKDGPEAFSPGYLKSLLEASGLEDSKSAFSDRESVKEIVAKVSPAALKKFRHCMYVAISADSTVVDGDQNEFELGERVAQRGVECLVISNPAYCGPKSSGPHVDAA
jgi:hypothetical protein